MIYQKYFKTCYTLLLGISFALLYSGCDTLNSSEVDDESNNIQEETLKLPSIDKFNTKVAYVSSISEGTVSSIDLENNTVKWTLKVSEGKEDRKPESAMGIASTLDGKLVFTGDVATNEAIIIDAEKQEIIKRIPLTHGVHAIDICPHGHWVWIAGILEEYPWLTATTVIDVEKLEKTMALSPALGGVAHFAWTPDAKEVWAASISTNTVWVWDAINKKVLDVIPLIPGNLDAASPEAEFGLIGFNEIAIAPDGERAFAVGPEAGIVFAIDVKERKPLRSVKVGERAHGIGVTRDGKEVWTANNTGTVTILDAASMEILDQIDLSRYADELPYSHIAFSLDGKKAYVSIAKDIAVINVSTREVLTTIPFGYGTHEISLEDFYVEFEGTIPRQAGMQATASTQDNQSAGDMTRRSEKAGITITVTPQKADDDLIFEISMDTHSGDLMNYDLTKLAILHLSSGKPIASGFKWEPESESSHHRKGVLKVDLPEKDIAVVELELKGIGVPSRKFKWENYKELL